MSHASTHFELPREVSKKRKIYNMLLADIQDGSLPVGTRLPTTAKLSEQWRVAHATAHAALKELSRDGWLVRHPRQGTFVSSPIQNLNGHLKLTLGMVLPPRQDIEAAFCRLETFEILQGLTAGARKVGWHVRIETIPDHLSVERKKHAMEALKQTPIAAFIGSVQYSQLIKSLGAEGHPVVTLFGNDLENGHVVNYDRPEAVRLGTQHLIDRGYRRIGFFCKTNDIKFQLFKTALSESEVFHGQGFTGDYSSLSGAESAARRFLQSNPGMDAIFAGNYQAALALVREIRSAGLRVPQDIAVMAYGIESDSGAMPLSYVRVPYWECGVEAMKLIAQSHAAPYPRQIRTIPPELILREST